MQRIKKDDCKALCRCLQRLESKVMFRLIVPAIQRQLGTIPPITIHDSICVPLSYAERVESIVNDVLREAKNSTHAETVMAPTSGSTSNVKAHN